MNGPVQQRIVEIEQFLPHRRPMLMVDKIITISPTNVLCSFLICSDNVFVRDEIFQEVGLIENMAQTCSSIVGQTFYDDTYNPTSDERIIGFISAIKHLSVLTLPKVGDEIMTNALLTSQFDGEDYTICTMSVEANYNQEVLAKAEINLFLKKQ